MLKEQGTQLTGRTSRSSQNLLPEAVTCPLPATSGHCSEAAGGSQLMEFSSRRCVGVGRRTMTEDTAALEGLGCVCTWSTPYLASACVRTKRDSVGKPASVTSPLPRSGGVPALTPLGATWHPRPDPKPFPQVQLYLSCIPVWILLGNGKRQINVLPLNCPSQLLAGARCPSTRQPSCPWGSGVSDGGFRTLGRGQGKSGAFGLYASLCLF